MKPTRTLLMSSGMRVLVKRKSNLPEPEVIPKRGRGRPRKDSAQVVEKKALGKRLTNQPTRA
jgi:hypothetical protein